MGSVGFSAPLIKDTVAWGDCRSGSNVSLALGGDGGSIAFCKGSKLHRRHGASSARRVLARDLGRVRCFPILFGIPKLARA